MQGEMRFRSRPQTEALALTSWCQLVGCVTEIGLCLGMCLTQNAFPGIQVTIPIQDGYQ